MERKCSCLDCGSATVQHPLSYLCNIFLCTVWRESTFLTCNSSYSYLANMFSFSSRLLCWGWQWNLVSSDLTSPTCVWEFGIFYLFFGHFAWKIWLMKNPRSRWGAPLLSAAAALISFRWFYCRSLADLPHALLRAHTATQTVSLASFILFVHQAGDHESSLDARKRNTAYILTACW